MAGYSPLKITGNEAGLVQEREEFLLPDDAYPVLQNAYVWREKIKRKRGYQLLGRLQRNFSIAGISGGSPSPFAFNAFTTFGISLVAEPNATLVPGAFTYSFGAPNAATFIDNGMGGFVVTGDGVSAGSSINYITGAVVLAFMNPIAPGKTTASSMSYYPGFPVMGLRIRELLDSTNDQTIAFDQKYAYDFNAVTNQFEEFIPGTTWNAHNAGVAGTDFFFSTNYWVSDPVNFPDATMPYPLKKLFWVTNNTGQFGANADPIRVTDGIQWLDFSPPNFGQIDAQPTYLLQCLAFLPFRGRLVTFNTYEGATYATYKHYSNRIRWSTIGNPFIPFSAGPPATGSWRDDIRGQGGFLDIPTSEDIVAVGFVRDNLVIYCERSTWQLRYTGRSISPFNIERVNSELGCESTFSAVQFDTSLVGIGDKGIVECNSYESKRIDVKIPDFVFGFNNLNGGPRRVQGIRDFVSRLAYWTIPFSGSYEPNIGSVNWVFPNQRLVYNYENDSWAIFSDSLTVLGTYQAQSSRTWINTAIPWIQCNFNWLDQPQGDPTIIGGNQQGFVEYLDELTVNDVSLYISAITANTTTSTLVKSPNHNMSTGFVIVIKGIPHGTPFDNLNTGLNPSTGLPYNANNGVFGIRVKDKDSFYLYIYNPSSNQFNTPQLDIPGSPYIGGGLIAIRENFSIQSKKFNFLDEGQNIQLGYIDILMPATGAANPGAISVNVYLDYNDIQASNTLPENVINDGTLSTPDTFFNSIIPTTGPTFNTIEGTKFWQRVFCATRSNFITIEYKFSNAQLAGIEQELNVQIDAQILWIRKAGRMTSF